VLDRLPLLVVELAPRSRSEVWLHAGVPEVWTVGSDAVLVHRSGRAARRIPLPGTVRASERRLRDPAVLPCLELALPLTAPADEGVASTIR
jgi:hypothetical protein